MSPFHKRMHVAYLSVCAPKNTRPYRIAHLIARSTTRALDLNLRYNRTPGTLSENPAKLQAFAAIVAHGRRHAKLAQWLIKNVSV